MNYTYFDAQKHRRNSLFDSPKAIVSFRQIIQMFPIELSDDTPNTARFFQHWDSRLQNKKSLVKKDQQSKFIWCTITLERENSLSETLKFPTTVMLSPSALIILQNLHGRGSEKLQDSLRVQAKT